MDDKQSEPDEKKDNGGKQPEYQKKMLQEALNVGRGRKLFFSGAHLEPMPKDPGILPTLGDKKDPEIKKAPLFNNNPGKDNPDKK